MLFLGRAKFNLLQRSVLKNSSLEVDPWQVKNYRSLSIDQIFDGLREIGLELDPDAFEDLAEESDSPEELSELITTDHPKLKKRVYLFIFELWRRLLDDRETISIFADELDWVLVAYEKNPRQESDLLQTLLFELSNILDCNVDEGGRPKPLFKYISRYLAEDLESNIYSYIFDLIEGKNKILASKLCDRFYDYVRDVEWFDLLKLKLLTGALEEDVTAIQARFMEKLKEKNNLDLYFEFLRHLIESGQIGAFMPTYKHVLSQIKTEEQFVEMLDIIFQYYNLNDLEEEEQSLRTYIQKRKQKPPHNKISPVDIKHLTQIVV